MTEFKNLQKPVPLDEVIKSATLRAYNREVEDNRALKARVTTLEMENAELVAMLCEQLPVQPDAVRCTVASRLRGNRPANALVREESDNPSENVPERGHDGCVWNPNTSRYAHIGDAHHLNTPATVMLGSGDNMHRLCEMCSRLPRFGKLRKRKAIVRGDS